MAVSSFPGKDPGRRLSPRRTLAGELSAWFVPAPGAVSPRIARARGIVLAAALTAYPAGTLLAGSLGISSPPGRYFVAALFATALSLSLRPAMLSGRARALPSTLMAYLKFLPVPAAAAVLGNLIFPGGLNPLLEEFIAPGGSFALLKLIGLAVFLGPLAEEACFRGLLYPALASRISPAAAAAVSAGVFAAYHGNPASFAAIFALGFFLAGTYERSGSLRAPLVVHSLHNAISLLVFFLVRTVGNSA